MTKAVYRRNEIIFGCGLGVTRNQFVQNLIVGIGKKDGFYIGIAGPHVLHSVFLFVTPRQFVLLDNPIHVIIYACSDDKTVLRLAVHRLCIEVILLLFILHEPAVALEFLKVLGSTFIDTRVVLTGSNGEIDFGFDDMIQAFLIGSGLLACLFRAQHVVRSALDRLDECFWGAQSPERFDFRHDKNGIKQAETKNFQADCDKTGGLEGSE